VIAKIIIMKILFGKPVPVLNTKDGKRGNNLPFIKETETAWIGLRTLKSQ
jgi:hypothetical protein